MLGGKYFFATWLGPAENPRGENRVVGSIYRRLAARLRDYGPADYWMSRTLAELADWVDDIVEVAKDEQETIEQARQDAGHR